MKAKLILSDWTSFEWTSFWYETCVNWEVVFNTW